MAGSVWFGHDARFTGGLVPVGGDTLDYLDSKIENGEHVAYLPSCNVPFLTWVPIENGIEIREVYRELMLHTDVDIRVRYANGIEDSVLEEDRVSCLLKGNYRKEVFA